MKPILFNTEMVRAILDGRKTVTRRVVKYTANAVYGAACVNGRWYEQYTPGNPPESLIEWYIKEIAKPPYRPGDILYVRETFFKHNGKYYYKADRTSRNRLIEISGVKLFNWHPSIHMPKEAARIFLRVENVRVERLLDITEEQAEQEGLFRGWQMAERSSAATSARQAFMWIWGSTTPPRYGWDANPWVWVIEFKQISKEEALKNES